MAETILVRVTIHEQNLQVREHSCDLEEKKRSPHRRCVISLAPVFQLVLALATCTDMLAYFISGVQPVAKHSVGMASILYI